jgi:uncharacterized membrane protein YkvA (DUF1232 family)
MSTSSDGLSGLETQLLDQFAEWTSALGQHAILFADELENPENSRAVRTSLACGLLYLVKSIDLIDDGIENLGYLDDAMVLRLVLQGAQGAIPEGLQGLRGDSGLLSEFLGALAPRFEQFIRALREVKMRGRVAQELVDDAEAVLELCSEVRAFGARYHAPALSRDASLLVKAHAFLDAKLPKN